MELLHRLLFLPERASNFADLVDGLHYFVLLTTMVVSTGVGLTTLFFFVRFRRRKEGQLVPPLRPLWVVEAAFVLVPTAFFLTWFGIGFREFVKISSPPPDAEDVFVVAKQWMWQFSYPDGPSAVDVLHVPMGRPVRLLLTSRDVIHSFFVPAFRLKQDVLPGRYTQAWFIGTKVGRFEVLCAEYCGTQHSMMRGAVQVLEPTEYDRWLEGQKSGTSAGLEDEPLSSGSVGSLPAQGMRLAVSLGCLKCHSVDGSPHIGPTWRGLYLRRERLESGETAVADVAYLTRSMMDPQAEVVAGFKPVMPSFFGRLDPPQTAALVEYIRSLSTARAEDVEQGPQR